ncbi:hypothetical protein [Halorhabdus salina]|uniref:hypothetical protein n=1 Tax=Halorhabdus salina TaxID=2750670 RepID=UPI0015EEDB77|nr:hypothetical protein [Halorhabdus salina]
MSSTDNTSPEATFELPAVPAAEADPSSRLDRAFDDREDPSTLTVFPADAEWPEIGTTWISVDVDHAVTVTDYR